MNGMDKDKFTENNTKKMNAHVALYYRYKRWVAMIERRYIAQIYYDSLANLEYL